MKGHFLQSKEWEEFQKSLGRKVFRIDGALITKLPLIFGKSYLYCAGTSVEQNLQTIFAPRKGETSSTPLLDKTNDSPLKSQKLFVNFAKQEDAVFFKFEPLVEDQSFAENLMKAGFLKSKKEVQPQRTIILDLAKGEEELLREMHPKTRYNIRVAEKHSVEIRNSNLETLWGLLQKTAQRDKFGTHTREYYEKLLELPITQLFTAQYRGKIIAANLILFYGDTAYYLHGASDYEYRNLMAPYLLHWETVKYAKEQGFQEYDLWGIDEEKWPGVTRFKRGFGDREVEYVGSYDYVFQPLWYKLYMLRHFLNSKLLRFVSLREIFMNL